LALNVTITYIANYYIVPSSPVPTLASVRDSMVTCGKVGLLFTREMWMYGDREETELWVFGACGRGRKRKYVATCVK
jgi:hypothetical protein